jgi:hypothetical protein
MAEKQNQNQYLDFLTIHFMLEMVQLLPGNLVYAGYGHEPKSDTLNYIFTQWIEAKGDVLTKGRFAVKNYFDRALRVLNLSSQVFYDQYRNIAVYKGITLDLNLVEKTDLSSKSGSVNNIIQTEPESVKIIISRREIMLKFDKLAKEKLFVLNQTIIHGTWSIYTMSGFATVMAVAHMELTESYARYFTGIVYKLEKHLDLNSPHPSNDILSNLRDWCTTILVLCAGVLQRLNICMNPFSLTEADKLAKDLAIAKNEEFTPWYASKDPISYAFPTSYSTVESGGDRKLAPLAPNENLTWELWDEDLQDAVASRLFTQEYGLQNYSFVRVDLIEFSFRVIAVCIGPGFVTII